MSHCSKALGIKTAGTTNNAGSRLEKNLFYSLLLLLLWLPAPWGSNTGWAKGLFCAWTFLLLGSWLLLFLKGTVRLTPAWQRARRPWYLLVMVQGCIVLQLVEWPIALVEALSPQAAAAYLAALPDAHAIRLSLDPAATRLELLLGCAYCALFFLLLSLVNDHARLRLLCKVLVISGLIQACYGAYMVLSGVEYSFFIAKDAHLGRATGTFLNRNHLANYLTMCLATGIGILIATMSEYRSTSKRDVARRWLATLLSPKARLRLYLAIMVIGLVLTVSRMGNSSFFLSLVIAGTIALLASRRLNRKLLVLLASLLVIDLLIVGEWFGFDKVVQRLEDTNLQQEERTAANRYVVAMVEDFPLTGTGAGSFGSTFPAYQGDKVALYYDHAHNDYLQFAAELGIPASLLLLAFAVLSLTVAVRAQFQRQDSWLQAMGFTATMAIIAMAIHATVEFNLRIPANAATFIVMLALAWLSDAMPGIKKSRPRAGTAVV